MVVFEPPDYRKLYEESQNDRQRLSLSMDLMRATLRDKFAMAALSAVIALESDAEIGGECHAAYLYADAMMKAREKNP